MGHQSFPYHQGRIGSKFCLRSANGGIHAFDLHHFHFHRTAFFQICFRHRIQDPFCASVPFAVMLFHIFYFTVLSYKKPMHAVMLRILHAAVMDAAAGHDHHVAVFPNIKIIVHCFLDAAGAEHHRNMHALILRAGFNTDVNAAYILFGNDINVRGSIAGRHLAVGPDIIRAAGNGVQIRNFRQQSFLNFINHSHPSFSGSHIRLLHCSYPAVRAGFPLFFHALPPVRWPAPRSHRQFPGFVPDGK